VSAKRKLRKLITERIEKTDDEINKISKLVTVVPQLQILKEDDETILSIIDATPDDVIEEFAPNFLRQETDRNRLIFQYFPVLPDLSSESAKLFATSASSTTSAYVTTISRVGLIYKDSNSIKPDWVPNVLGLLEEHSNKLAKREYLPDRLDKINHNLGAKYKVALLTFNKCKSKIITVDLAAIQLRSVLEDVWGGMLNIARERDEIFKKSNDRLEKRKEKHLIKVSEILASDVFPKEKIYALLTELNDLCFNLSDRKFGKNPLNNDFQLLNTYFNIWLALLDNISVLAL
jgi:hypothetical protein